MFYLQTDSMRDFFCVIFGRFEVDLPMDRFLCPVRAIRFYLVPTASVSLDPHESACPPTCVTCEFCRPL